jgi:hypothetical protein
MVNVVEGLLGHGVYVLSEVSGAGLDYDGHEPWRNIRHVWLNFLSFAHRGSIPLVRKFPMDRVEIKGARGGSYSCLESVS